MSARGLLLLAMLYCCVAATSSLSCGGGGDGSGEGDDSEDDDDDDDVPPILDPSHLGWKNPDCAACHSLPEEDHSQTDPPECAGCHGGNGACDPNGPNSGQQHTEADDCVFCHAQQHGFDENWKCAACHFIGAGNDDCSATDTDTGNDTLVDDCFNWPDEEFSPSNNVGGLSTGVSEGQPAIDFTLQDTGGAEHTLSTLLETKPVLLVFGSYT